MFILDKDTLIVNDSLEEKTTSTSEKRRKRHVKPIEFPPYEPDSPPFDKVDIIIILARLIDR